MDNLLLPVGSVVLLNNGKKRLMIYGVLQKQNNTNTVFDYIGCYYPEGYINPEHTFLFNTSDISEISYIGFIDSEYQLFDERVKKAAAERKAVESENEES